MLNSQAIITYQCWYCPALVQSVVRFWDVIVSHFSGGPTTGPHSPRKWEFKQIISLGHFFGAPCIYLLCVLYVLNAHYKASFIIQNRVWRIFGYSNIFEYFPVRIFIRIIFVSFFWCEYIQIFIRIVFFYTNIFGYSFVSFFWYEYIQIFVHGFFNQIYLRERSNVCANRSKR